MERDFMGLSSKEPLASVKREIPDEVTETQWSFMKNASSHPHLMSFKPGASLDDGMTKMNSPLSLDNPLPKPNFSSYGQNPAGATMRQQFLGIPMTVTSPVNAVVGFTDPWNNKKSLGGPAQMTIFYAGTVSVYDEISPEKAEAIMLLARNGLSLTSNLPLATSQVSSPVTKVAPAVVDAVVSNHPLSSNPCPDFMNQSSVSSHPILQTSSLAGRKDEQLVTKTTGISSAPVIKPEPQRAVASRGPITMSIMTPSAIPQFRKASLARFLEKRKERVMSAAPYGCGKKQEEGIIAPVDDNLGSASTSANSMTTPSAAVRGS